VLWGQGAAEALNTRPVKIQQLPAPHQRRKILNTPQKFGGWVGAFFDIHYYFLFLVSHPL
jgi:hypothetical protein